MKIYELSKIPGIGTVPPEAPDYEAIYASGYSAGYEAGYASVPCDNNPPLTLEITSMLDIGPNTLTNKSNQDLEYSLDGGFTWAPFDTVSLITGDVIQFRGHVNCEDDQRIEPIIYDEGLTYKAYGNIMSVINGADYLKNTEFPHGTSLRKFFVNSSGLTDASGLKLPAMNIPRDGYVSMFQNCKAMYYGPTELPATGLSPYCYSYMFGYCDILAVVPEILPATTLAEGCYTGMFFMCGFMEKLPVLPAPTLVKGCYNAIHFMSSSDRLNYVKCLATDIGAEICTSYWLGIQPRQGGTFVKAAGMNDWPTGVLGIPEGWTVIDA